MRPQWDFFPGFGNMKTFACFRVAGQYSSVSIALNICRPLGGISGIIRAVMRSKPGSLNGCRCLITCVSSGIMKAHSFSERWAWVSSFRSTSGSKVVW
jgi:hypothetical protein